MPIHVNPWDTIMSEANAFRDMKGASVFAAFNTGKETRIVSHRSSLGLGEWIEWLATCALLGVREATHNRPAMARVAALEVLVSSVRSMTETLVKQMMDEAVGELKGQKSPELKHGDREPERN